MHGKFQFSVLSNKAQTEKEVLWHKLSAVLNHGFLGQPLGKVGSLLRGQWNVLRRAL